MSARTFPDGFPWLLPGRPTRSRARPRSADGALDLGHVQPHPEGTTCDDTGGVATDHCHRYDHDLDLAAGLNLSAYRFSIARPRVQSHGHGPMNPAGIAFYDQFVDGLLPVGSPRL